MTSPKNAAHMLHDLHQWAPLLTNAATTLLSPRAGTPNTHTPHTHRDLGDLLAPILDAPDEGAPALRTHAQITAWATTWAECADLTSYTSHPLLALANAAPRLAEHWKDWESFTDDLTLLHARTARLTGHTPRTIGPCPTRGCMETVTQQQTRRGAEGPLECPRGHTWTTLNNYRKDAARIITKPGVILTATEIHDIYPDLNRERLKKWAQRGKITRNTHGYDLAEINALMQKMC
ncbi:hypothetical protein G7Y41_08830 [Schaalia sp. ZJ405]|uniref:hypothetical protein n=1 Tax=Schaalia sp. ZJ405 TaxID=2709403 RepID=UPI0013EA0303|nr:hypothetical protein [Schaalia sp. ZJ405]QPK81129.1 hypothetical protein G7Y41_08830 [Schaalia sp. ZJ405]